MATMNIDTSGPRFPSGAAETHYRTIPEPTAEDRRRAARAVAAAALDAGDCATLLDMLGLEPDEGLS